MSTRHQSFITASEAARPGCGPLLHSIRPALRWGARPGRGASGRTARALLGVGFLGLLLCAGVSPSEAHLSIIRQGHEAAGAFEVGDQTGRALAAGDFNGDGRDDLAMGAPGEDIAGGFTNAGAVIISWGSPTGVTHVGSIVLTAANSGGVNQTDAEFGRALLAGDWNNDGYDDLAIGCPRDNLGSGLPGAGMVYLMAGSANGLVPWIQLDQADAAATPENDDRFGSSFAAGDFNGDGRLDLAVGSPGEDSFRGAFSYFLNSAIGVPFGGSATLTPVALGFAGASGDQFGLALAAGNFAGGAQDDLAVGVPYFDDAQTNAGAFWIVRGSSGGLTTSQATFYTGWDFSTGIGAGHALGYALAAGRFFDGPYESLAIGEPFANVAGFADAGRVLVCPGSSGGLQTASALVLTANFGQGQQSEQFFGRALATGRFQTTGPDHDDLAIASPGRRVGDSIPAGQVQVHRGRPSGPSTTPIHRYDQTRLGEQATTGALFGSALVFGHFDGSAQGALAAGAFGMTGEAGQVHVIAPWRQALDLSCRHSVAYDCEGTLVFSQKPFDQVMIASTTKTMTVLIAAERSQLPPSDPRYVSLQEEYVVPAWVADNIPGSQVPLVTAERMTLIDLMYTCMLRSGNDAANAIADLLWGGGGPNISLPLFVAEMNQRAAELGMTGTHFHNPAGLDNEPVGPELGEHYSTPVDMAKLSRAAVENPIVAEIVATANYPMTRWFRQPDFTYDDEPWDCGNIFAGVLMNGIQPASGIKGGRTPGAQTTGLFSATAPNGGTALAGTYFLTADEGSAYVPDAASLLQVGLAECNFPLVFSPESLPFARYFPNLPTQEGKSAGGTVEFPVGMTRGVLFSLLRQSGDGSVRVGMEIGRVSETLVPGDGSVRFGIAPFQAHGGFRVQNMGTESIDLALRAAEPAFAAGITLAPGESFLVPPASSPDALPEFGLTIINGTPGVDAYLSVEEVYSFETEIGGFQLMESFQADLAREGEIVNDGFWFRVIGGDPVGDGELYLGVHQAGTTVDAPGIGIGPGGEREPALSGIGAAPNPFRETTRIGFDLAGPAEVALELFDAQGRAIRQAPPQRLPAGRFHVEWDGRDAEGRRLPPGVYFYRLVRDGRPSDTGKVVRAE